MNWIIPISIIVAIIAFAFTQRQTGFNQAIADAVKKRYYDLVNNLNLFQEITNEDVMAIICVESGSYIMQGKDSKTIPSGDNGKSYGLMQVKQFNALPSMPDLTDDTNNLIAGMTVLDKCFASNNGDRFKAYECYNDGKDKYFYAQDVMKYFDYYTKGS